MQANSQKIQNKNANDCQPLYDLLNIEKQPASAAGCSYKRSLKATVKAQRKIRGK